MDKPVEGTPAEKEAEARLEKEQESLPKVFKNPTLDITEEQIVQIKTKPLAELFGIKDINSDLQEDLNLIYKWVLGERGSDSRADFVEAVKSLSDRLGIPTVSNASFHQLVNWVRADMAEKAARKEKMLYER